MAVSGQDIRLITAACAARILRVPGVRDHKYTRGVARIAAGSDTFPGAGILSVAGASGVGTGMVRLVSTERVENLVLAYDPGTVIAEGYADAVLVGPGMDEERRTQCQALLRHAIDEGVPAVVDAGALSMIAPLMQANADLSGCILTPHAGEAARLAVALGSAEDAADEDLRQKIEATPATWARNLAITTGATVVLKGAVTYVSSPSGRLHATTRGIGWAGVAGSGDVLAGAIAGCAAQSRGLGDNREYQAETSACAGVWLHHQASHAAAHAIRAHTRRSIPHSSRHFAAHVRAHNSGTRHGHPITALDIARKLPHAVGRVVSSLPASR